MFRDVSKKSVLLVGLLFLLQPLVNGLQGLPWGPPPQGWEISVPVRTGCLQHCAIAPSGGLLNLPFWVNPGYSEASRKVNIIQCDFLRDKMYSKSA